MFPPLLNSYQIISNINQINTKMINQMKTSTSWRKENVICIRYEKINLIKITSVQKNKITKSNIIKKIISINSNLRTQLKPIWLNYISVNTMVPNSDHTVNSYKSLSNDHISYIITYQIRPYHILYNYLPKQMISSKFDGALRLPQGLVTRLGVCIQMSRIQTWQQCISFWVNFFLKPQVRDKCLEGMGTSGLMLIIPK